MKKLVMAAIAVLSVSMLNAQADKDFEDLLVLLIDGKYEKCMNRALGYTEKDDTRKHPLPYLYVGMAYFEMSKDEEYREDYPKALKNAGKYTIKYRKKDKDLTYWDEFQNFFSELRERLIEDSENWLTEGNAKKAHYNYKQMVSFDPDDLSAHFMKGVCELKLNMPTEAVKSFKLAMDKLNAIKEFNKLTIEKQELFKFGLMNYADYLIEDGRADSAKKTLTIGYPYFESDQSYKAKYTSIEY